MHLSAQSGILLLKVHSVVPHQVYMHLSNQVIASFHLNRIYLTDTHSQNSVSYQHGKQLNGSYCYLWANYWQKEQVGSTGTIFMAEQWNMKNKQCNLSFSVRQGLLTLHILRMH